MWKKKDNLTDVVEQLPKVQVSTPQGDQQEVNVAGEVVTLGHEKQKGESKEIQGFSLELPVDQLKEAITSAIDEVFERMKKRQNRE